MLQASQCCYACSQVPPPLPPRSHQHNVAAMPFAQPHHPAQHGPGLPISLCIEPINYNPSHRSTPANCSNVQLRKSHQLTVIRPIVHCKTPALNKPVLNCDNLYWVMMTHNIWLASKGRFIFPCLCFCNWTSGCFLEFWVTDRLFFWAFFVCTLWYFLNMCGGHTSDTIWYTARNTNVYNIL